MQRKKRASHRVMGMGAGLRLACPVSCVSPHVRFRFPSQGLSLEVFLGTSILVQAFENENPPGVGAILTEVLRVSLQKAGRST